MHAQTRPSWSRQLARQHATVSLQKMLALVPFSKRLLLIIWPFLVIIAVLVALGDISMDALSSIRAFAAAESLWSRAQKDAVYHLGNYAVSRSETDYVRFRAAIRIPLGYRKACEELEKTTPDYRIVYTGFIEGGTHPGDIPGMIRLIGRFRRIGHIDGIALWAKGDGYVAKLDQSGEELRQQIVSGHADAQILAPILAQIRMTNDQLDLMELTFSSALGAVSRRMYVLLLITTLAAAGSLGLLGTYLARRMLQRSEAFEQALRLSEERFRLAITGSNDGLWDWNLSADEVYRSPRFNELLGYADHDLEGHRIAFGSLLHPEDRDATLAAIEAHLARNIAYDMECRLRTKSGEYRWFRIRGQAVRDSEGNAVRVAGAVTDVTDRKRSEEHIRQLNAELEERVAQRTAELQSILQELEAFSYSVSHDLRAPLRHISAYSTMLQKTCAPLLTNEGQQYLDKILKSAKRMNDLIRDLLEFSHMGRAELRQKRVNMDNLVFQVVQEMRDSAPERNIEWQIAPLPEVLADQAMLRQVWTNLLSNAVKYTAPRDPAVIKVGCQNDSGNEWIFFVQDNGAGFNMQYADKLFGVFQRLHRAEEFEGTGIGLANVRRIVARHGGRTWAEGKVDEGAVFYFTLPHTVE